MNDFSGMDTNIYWNQAKKYLPEEIGVLFIAESPPAFKDPNKKAYFYCENSYGGDMLFATIMKAILYVDYSKNPQRKKILLEEFKNKKKCFLVDAVRYPINRDIVWRPVPPSVREKHLLKNQEVLLELLSDMKKNQHIVDSTKFILIKKTVYDILYDTLSEKYEVLNEHPIGFPRWHRDPLVVANIRKVLGYSL